MVMGGGYLSLVLARLTLGLKCVVAEVSCEYIYKSLNMQNYFI